MVGPQTLNLSILVRVQVPEQKTHLIMTFIISCHPLEEGDPGGMDSRLRGNDR